MNWTGLIKKPFLEEISLNEVLKQKSWYGLVEKREVDTLDLT